MFMEILHIALAAIAIKVLHATWWTPRNFR